MADLQAPGLQQLVERGSGKILLGHIREQGIGHVDHRVHHRPSLPQAVHPAAAGQAGDLGAAGQGELLPQGAGPLHLQGEHLGAQSAVVALGLLAVARQKAGALVKELGRGHKGAAALDPADKALALQLGQGLAQGGPADPQGSCQLCLRGEPVPHLVGAALYAGAQCFHHLLIAVACHGHPSFRLLAVYTGGLNL